MNLPFVFVTLFQVVLTQNYDEIIKYVGDTVTLPSGGISSPSRIAWSILSNTTIIARHQSKRTYTELFPQYYNRLRLDESTGDLTIRNLKTQDSLVYKVELHNPLGVYERRIKLSVRQRLPEPTIEVVFSTLTKGSRLVGLKCSSAEEGVDFTWQVTAPLLTGSIIKSGELVAVYDSLKGPAKFTCNTTRDNERTSRTHLDLIEEEPSPGPLPHCRDGRSICVIVVSSGAVVIVVFLLYCKNKYDLRKNETTAPSA